MALKKKVKTCLGGVAVIACLWIGAGLRNYIGHRFYHESFFVGFTDRGTPHLNVAIENRLYPVELNLGTKFEMELNPETIEKYHLDQRGIVEVRNETGERLERSIFTLPKMQWGNFTFSNIAVASDERLRLDSDKTSKGCFGVLGKNLLRKKNLLFDMKRSVIIVSNDKKRLNDERYPLYEYIRVPFTETPSLIVMEVETDQGQLSLCLGTATEVTVLKDSFATGKNLEISEFGIPVKVSKKFSIGGHDFGNKEVYFYSFGQDIPFDGILGMDFFHEHVVYLDFAKHVAHISP